MDTWVIGGWAISMALAGCGLRVRTAVAMAHATVKAATPLQVLRALTPRELSQAGIVEEPHPIFGSSLAEDTEDCLVN